MDFLGGVWELALHRELMEIHIQTLFEMDESGALLRENEVDGRRGPILYMGAYLPGRYRDCLRHRLPRGS